MEIIVFVNHECPVSLAYRLERHAKKTGRPIPPTPPRTYTDLGTGEEARRLVHIPKGDGRDVDAILDSLDTTPITKPRTWPTATRRA